MAGKEKKKAKKPQKIPEINVGLTGHVDHGKTSLTQALAGKWADTHSEELKRGITIRIGYADVTFYKCKEGTYGTSDVCIKCMGPCEPVRAISLVDAPGHETLMATVLSGAALMDGAVLVVAADEECPQPQTAEHLKALDVVGIDRIVIAQNKIDLVSEEDAKKNYKQIKKFTKGTVAENAPVVPISAVHNANIDALIEAIEGNIPTPERRGAEARFYVARSFDINRPGTPISDLKGGVVGGSVVSGSFKKGDEIMIAPGVRIKENWQPLLTKIVGVIHGDQNVDEARPGGLVALQTDFDPALTRSDSLAGAVAGRKLPEAKSEIVLKPNLFDHVIGVEGHKKVGGIKTNDVLMLTAAIAKTVGTVASATDTLDVKLKLPVVAEKGDKISISKQIDGRWHLIGWGAVE